MCRSSTALGIVDSNLARLGVQRGVKGENHCRRLHAFARKTECLLSVRVQKVQTIVRQIEKSKVHEVEIDYPVLPLSSWMETSFNLGGHFFLGGKGLSSFSQFSKILCDFWRRYRPLDPDLPFFEDVGEPYYHCSFPVAVHGDEGRGRYKRPILVLSFQPVLSNMKDEVNLKGSGLRNSLGWCFLLPLLPSPQTYVSCNPAG